MHNNPASLIDLKEKFDVSKKITPIVKSRFLAIDGLRGAACLSVVALHCYALAGFYPTPFFSHD